MIHDIPGPVVSVLAAWLQVKIVQCPILQLLTEILDADLRRYIAKNIKPHCSTGPLHD